MMTAVAFGATPEADCSRVWSVAGVSLGSAANVAPQLSVPGVRDARFFPGPNGDVTEIYLEVTEDAPTWAKRLHAIALAEQCWDAADLKSGGCTFIIFSECPFHAVYEEQTAGRTPTRRTLTMFARPQESWQKVEKDGKVSYVRRRPSKQA